MMNRQPDEIKPNRLSRRNFLKIGAATGASASVLGAAPVQIWKEHPVRITEKCQRMEQKYTGFCRELWDQEFVERIMLVEKKVDRAALQKTDGWTALDRALNAAGWALDHKFASGSENGQPHSQAYAWDERARRQKVEFSDAQDAARKVKKAARFLGASLVGVADYDPLWTYATLVKIREEEEESEGPPAFDSFVPEFPFEPRSVVVIAVEMDYEGIATSPSSLEGAATGLGYSHMASVGYSVATFLRELGYRSFALGNDVALSVPYAIASGMGELGRHGLLITPEYGPRVRLAKVFTELELTPDKPRTFGVWEFCKSCKRCAESCPSQAISFDEPTLEGPTISNNPGVQKWYIDPEKCLEFWVENGSDCSNCITACPYNKLDLWHHQLASAATGLPGSSLHSLMARMDKLFGFGNTHDIRANAAFWK
ncbi:MAG: reductive dehalogenase [Candidatus Aminicenantes bacterium]|nr:reductive dehalogenase [Candidatus Aminicenantes bacterium]